MKQTILLALATAIAALSFSFINKPLPAGSEVAEQKAIKVETRETFTSHDHANEVSNLGTMLYSELKLGEKGLSKSALDIALKGYLSLVEQGALKNPDVLSIVDFSQSSRQKRFYLLDVKNKKLLENTFVAHGKNSGVDIANSFSNVIGSEKSSLGFYITKGKYTGKNGFSLRMSGLDKGFNDNAEARAIAVHGADYVNASHVQSAYMGRSQGCPALPRENFQKVIGLIKDGTALFIYYPSTAYLQNSTLLNS